MNSDYRSHPHYRALEELAVRKGYSLLPTDSASGDSWFLLLEYEADWTPPREYAPLFVGSYQLHTRAVLGPEVVVGSIQVRYERREPRLTPGREYRQLLEELPRLKKGLDIGAIILTRNAIRGRIQELESTLEECRRGLQRALIIPIKEAQNMSSEEVAVSEKIVRELWYEAGRRGRLQRVEEAIEPAPWSDTIKHATTTAVTHFGREIDELLVALAILDWRRYYFDLVVNNLILGKDPPRWEEVASAQPLHISLSDEEARQRKLLNLPTRMEYIGRLREEQYSWDEAYAKLNVEWEQAGVEKEFPYAGPDSMRSSWRQYNKRTS